MNHFLRDLRIAARSLRKSPGFTLAAVACLALGVGATSAIFSLVDAVLLKPLPYAEPGKVYVVWNEYRAANRSQVPLSRPEYLDVRDQKEVFADAAALVTTFFNLTGRDTPERFIVGRASASLFPMLGVEAELGRVFRPEEDDPGQGGVVVLSHQTWERRFGADKGILGQTLSLDGKPYVVIGVLPADFELGTAGHDLWVPIAFNLASSRNRDARGIFVAARLAPGVTAERAQAAMEGLAQHFVSEYPDVYPAASGYHVDLMPIRDEMLGDSEALLLSLFAASGLVLLIACVNVANLLLARGVARSRELALRTALGATRNDLLRQCAAESVLLAGAGGLLGLLLARWGLSAARGVAPRYLHGMESAGLQGSVLLFTLGVAVACGLVFGLVPVFQARRLDLQSSLKAAGRSVGARRRRVTDLLVVVEVALAVVVLIGAGLVTRSFRAMNETDLGFRKDHLLTLNLSLPAAKYGSPQAMAGFYQALREKVAGMAGVEAAGVVSHLPLGFIELRGDVEAEDRPAATGEPHPVAEWRMVSPDYFQAIGIPVVKGRTFTDADDLRASEVVMLDEPLAHHLWPGEDPIGKRVRLLGRLPGSPDTGWRTVVGLVAHANYRAPSLESGDQLYLPYPQYPYPLLSLVLRTTGDPAAVAAAARAAVWAVDPDQSVYAVRTIEERLAEVLTQPRFALLLFVCFGGVALVLALVGVYGVMSHAVAQRAQEIGVRMALGAQRREVQGLVIRAGMTLAGAGLGVGVVASLGLGRYMRSLLYQVRASDPATFAVVVSVLAAAALLACYLPARRATRVDPVVTLRAE